MADFQPTVLVIEDEDAIRKFMRISLTVQNYRIIESATGADGELQAASAQPDVVILDLGLPDVDGLSVLKQIREWSEVPVIVVSARGKEQDKVAALDSGADDYLTKPFGLSELMARLRVALRRRQQSPTESPVFTNGTLTVDLAKHEVVRAGEAIHLTPNEFRLLSVLVRHAGRVITHTHLLREVWGPGSLHETHYLRVYMNQLRRKIEADPSDPKYLITEPGVGYRLLTT